MLKKKPKRKRAKRLSANAYTVHLLAGAAGELLNGLASVAITQFPGNEFRIVLHPMQDTAEKLETTLNKLSDDKSIVVHALADEAAKRSVRNTCVVRHIPHFDATGELISFFSDCVGTLPQNDVTRLYQLDADYQHRIEAMEFTLEHDDSLGLRSILDADVVIVGVSRVSKTPTALYLGSRGYKVANVSVTPEKGLPTELTSISKKKIVGLTTQPRRLQQIRAERARSIGLEKSAYDDLRSITRELMAAEEEYRRRKITVIDVTNLTIEQTASQILERLPLRRK